MRTAYFDTNDPEMYFDNPNLRWGSPSYLLEKGDPGYVDPFPSLNKTKQHAKKMKHNNYYPLKQADQIIWLTTFANKIELLGPGLGLTKAQIDAIVADCLWLIYLLQAWLPSTRDWSQTGTDALAEAQTGDGTALMVLPVYVVPNLPGATVPVNTGALTRIFAVVQDIKNSGKCSDQDQRTLGIIGSEKTGPDLTTLQPVFTLSIVGGSVLLAWNFGGYAAFLDACELQVDRADGKGYVTLAMDTTPGYTDTQPFPAVRTVWTYRATYLLNDKRVGVWSQPVSIAVQATAQA